MVTTLRDDEVFKEAMEVLFKHLEPAKVALFLSMCGRETGNYAAEREKLFGHMTLDEIYEEALRFQADDTAIQSQAPQASKES
jgi:hypothetical protein